MNRQKQSKPAIMTGSSCGEIALQKPGSKFKVPITTPAFPSKAFIWLPFTGGISAFAVILPNPIGSLKGA
jgi:hypothetical protein